MSKCQFIKSNKQMCQAKALQGEDFCFFHSSNKEVMEKRLKASIKGGENNKLETGGLTSKTFELKSVDQLMSLLEFTTNNLIQGKISREKASCIGYLSNILISAIKDHKFEERLGVIESAIGLSKQA